MDYGSIARYHQPKEHKQRSMKKSKPRPSQADCERKLRHYAGKNKWKQICKDVAQWRGVKMVYPPNLRVDRQDIDDANDQHLYFGDRVERYYVAIMCTWSHNDVHKGFEDHAYTNDPDSTINDFYRRLFAHQIDFAFDPDKDYVLLFQIFSMYYRRRYKQKQTKAEMQRKLARDKYEASAGLMTLASCAQDQRDTEHKTHVEGEEPHTITVGEDIAEAASLLMEAHGLDAEVILARATHLLGSAEGLRLFGNGPNTKAVAFSIDDGPKELIHWRFSNRIDRLIAFKPSGEILYTRCTIYWCSRTIAYFDEAYSFFKRRRLVNAGDLELFCPTCYVKMTNALFFGGHDPLGLHFGLLPSHNLQ